VESEPWGHPAQEQYFGLWLAVERATDRSIGFVGVSVPTFLPEILSTVEVGWRLEPSAWGKGYASEGARAALGESFTTLGLAEVCSLPQPDNPASVRVCERLGMRLERRIEIPANARRAALEGLLYKVTPAEWAALTGSRVVGRGLWSSRRNRITVWGGTPVPHS
jgi:RimJ/RimL family protein N-acetyltransferase